MVSCAAEMDAASQAAAAEGRSLAVVAAAAGGRGGGSQREPEGLPCPRCESVNTKFCYYNNYNLSQPRYFCRTCRRYWTRGGALRNVPVGGGTRKATPATTRRRRSTGGSQQPPAVHAPSSPAAALPPLAVPGGGGAGSYAALLRQYAGSMPSFPAQPLAAVDPDRRMLDLGGGSFTSLIAAGDVGGGGHFSAGFLVGGLAPGMAHTPAAVAAASSLPPPPQQQQQVSQALPEGLIWSMGWPDLSI
ncbi:hypothetical protein HU200_055843 [Digitaria exilis]|nr:hypothetical protein HU200_055843 [Digitaria exilis]CAB3475912.1 unnamed protein product [Digitaria exilis]